MEKNSNCQLPCLPNFFDGYVKFNILPLGNLIKRFLARPWNYSIKKWLKRGFHQKVLNPCQKTFINHHQQPPPNHQDFHAGDWVMVRSREEIESSLDQWKELKGCAFLDGMWQYCGTRQRVLKPMQRFLDERDYKVKKTRGIILLEGVLCQGTPVFGTCDRCCFLFWREEWLKKIEAEE